MDDADMAQRNEAVFQQRALEQRLAAMPQGEAAIECEECGAAIPEERRKAARGCTRCIRCQEQFERERR